MLLNIVLASATYPTVGTSRITALSAPKQLVGGDFVLRIAKGYIGKSVTRYAMTSASVVIGKERLSFLMRSAANACIAETTTLEF